MSIKLVLFDCYFLLADLGFAIFFYSIWVLFD